MGYINGFLTMKVMKKKKKKKKGTHGKQHKYAD